jgi:ankyrin repeat protein
LPTPPQDGLTVLHTAAFKGQLDFIDKILDKGVEIEAENKDVIFSALFFHGRILPCAISGITEDIKSTGLCSQARRMRGGEATHAHSLLPVPVSPRCSRAPVVPAKAHNTCLHAHPRIQTQLRPPLCWHQAFTPTTLNPPFCRLSAFPPQLGWSALHFVASLGHLDLIDKLIAMGADIDAKANDVPLRHPALSFPAHYLRAHPQPAASRTAHACAAAHSYALTTHFPPSPHTHSA